MQDWLDWLWNSFKLVAPWLTGGLAGATLTYLLNQRIVRRKQARLHLTTERVDYSLATRDSHLQELKVSYKGNQFDSLLFYQIFIENISARTIKTSPFLLILSEKTDVLEQISLTQPISRNISLQRQEGHAHAYLWDAGELKPRDSARLRLLVTSTNSIGWTWRGDDDVDVVAYGRETPQAFEKDLRNIVSWTVLYVATGSIPVISDLFHSIMLFAAMPYIVSLAARSWPLIGGRGAQTLNFVTNDESKVAISLGSGRAIIPDVPHDRLSG